MDRTEKKIALNKQINDIMSDLKDKAADVKILGKDVLIIGGLVVAGYALSKLLTGEDEEESGTSAAKEPSVLSSALKGAATSILLAVAKQKLTEYLENLNEESE